MEGYIGEIRMFAAKRAPMGWLVCDGRALNKDQFAPLHDIIRDTYGSAGNTFNIPDLSGRCAVGVGKTQNGVERKLGQLFGADTSAITPRNLPAHLSLMMSGALRLLGSITAKLRINSNPGDKNLPTNNYVSDNDSSSSNFRNTATANSYLAADAIEVNSTLAIDSTGLSVSIAGALGEGISVSQPSAVINFIICYQGNYPSFD